MSNKLEKAVFGEPGNPGVCEKNNLKASWSDYRKWGKGNHIRLRFSKSEAENIGKQYATHYVSQLKVEEDRELREFKDKQKLPIGNCGALSDEDVAFERSREDTTEQNSP